MGWDEVAKEVIQLMYIHTIPFGHRLCHIQMIEYNYKNTYIFKDDGSNTY